jgi:hypothetical protein
MNPALAAVAPERTLWTARSRSKVHGFSRTGVDSPHGTSELPSSTVVIWAHL